MTSPDPKARLLVVLSDQRALVSDTGRQSYQMTAASPDSRWAVRTKAYPENTAVAIQVTAPRQTRIPAEEPPRPGRAPALRRRHRIQNRSKTSPGELDLALSQVREAVLLTDLVGRAVHDRGKGVDLPEHPLPPRLLQYLPHGLAGNPPVLELGQDHPPDLIDRLIFMRRLKDVDPAGRGRSSVRDYPERPAPSLGGQSQRLRVRPLDGFPRPGVTQLGHHLRVGLQSHPELDILLGHRLQLHRSHVNAYGRQPRRSPRCNEGWSLVSIRRAQSTRSPHPASTQAKSAPGTQMIEPLTGARPSEADIPLAES